MELNKAVTRRIKKIAATGAAFDEIESDPDVTIDDFAGGNVDDAYYTGRVDGEIELARWILTKAEPENENDLILITPSHSKDTSLSHLTRGFNSLQDHKEN